MLVYVENDKIKKSYRPDLVWDVGLAVAAAFQIGAHNLRASPPKGKGFVFPGNFPGNFQIDGMSDTCLPVWKFPGNFQMGGMKNTHASC